MLLGIVSDIHEHTRNLRAALEHLASLECEKIVCLGDVFDTGKNLDATVAMLIEAGVVGVWGNHDVGVCFEPDRRSLDTYRAETIAYMQLYQPKLLIEDLAFSHIDPWLDPRLIEDLWYVEDEPWYRLDPERMRATLAERLAHLPDCVYLMGDHHIWLAANRSGPIDWDGTKPIALAESELTLVIIHAVVDGHFATVDTETRILTPYNI